MQIWQIFMTAVNAVAPIIGLIALGYILRRIGFMVFERFAFAAENFF